METIQKKTAFKPSMSRLDRINSSEYKVMNQSHTSEIAAITRSLRTAENEVARLEKLLLETKRIHAKKENDFLNAVSNDKAVN